MKESALDCHAIAKFSDLSRRYFPYLLVLSLFYTVQSKTTAFPLKSARRVRRKTCWTHGLTIFSALSLADFSSPVTSGFPAHALYLRSHFISLMCWGLHIHCSYKEHLGFLCACRYISTDSASFSLSANSIESI